MYNVDELEILVCVARWRPIQIRYAFCAVVRKSLEDTDMYMRNVT